MKTIPVKAIEELFQTGGDLAERFPRATVKVRWESTYDRKGGWGAGGELKTIAEVGAGASVRRSTDAEATYYVEAVIPPRTVAGGAP